MTDRPTIRLLIFIPTLQCGGSEKYVSILCNNIDTEKFYVCLVVLNNADPFYEIKNKNIEVIDLKKKRVLFSLFKIKRVVQKYKPDIIFTIANHLNLYLAIFRSLFPENIKFVARESSIVSINSRRAKFPWFYNRLIKKYYNRFDLIICQSAYMQRDLVSNYKITADKTVVIHNACADFLPAVKTVFSGGMAKMYKFITVARLSEEKGVERLIHAVGLLSLPFQFHIIGDGNENAALRSLVRELQMEDKIFFEGQRAEPFRGMEDADLFLMGSYYEGFPNALVEAGALGIPVIAFDVPGGIGEIITTGENGSLVDDNDIIGFASAIKKGLSLSFNRDSIMDATQKRFSLNAMMRATGKIFTGLLNS
jgi:glycosyltransferase involved in cell wall biosynthesis